MKRLFLSAALLAGLLSANASDIIPTPVSEKAGVGGFIFNSTENVEIPVFANDSVGRAFYSILGELQNGAGCKFTAGKTGRIALRTNSMLKGEDYKLRVTSDSIVIEAARPVGFFYGLQSLRQLLPVNSTRPAMIEAIEVTDSPRFGWRGFLLDESRHFFGKESVKRVIDMMALYKMNRFHWHLTDDQGWRVEIKKYPKLTTVGAERVGMHLGWENRQTADSYRYGPYFYTQKDIKEIVDYARDRFIEVIPEIDMPGHMQAAVTAYPELLACNKKEKHEVWNQAGVSRDVLNVAQDGVVNFAADVIGEISALFPFGYMHLGGDECPIDKWKETPECVKRLAAIGSDNYQDLQYDFYNRVISQHKAKGGKEKFIFWNEVLHGNTSLIGEKNEDITIMSWVDWEKDGKEAARRGMQTIMTPIKPFYINRKQSKNADEPYGAGTGTETLRAVYSYEPYENVPDSLQKQYVGVQANFWTEWVEGESQLQYLMLPRLAAVAERGWSAAKPRDFDTFLIKMKGWHAPYYKSKSWNHGDLTD